MYVNCERAAEGIGGGVVRQLAAAIYVKVTPASLYTLKTFSMALT